MNLPNLLTLLRLVLTVFFVACLSWEFPFHYSAALALFLVASFTDYLDGALARRWQLITNFGKLMDPLADKILTASAFICLITYNLVPAWAVIVIVSREFLITGLRLLASAKSVILPAEKLGKHKTAWQMITIVYLLGLLCSREYWSGAATFGTVYLLAANVLIGITIVLTLYSGAAYFWKNRSLLSESQS